MQRTSPTRSRRMELGDRSRQRIRQVASRLLAEKGYVGTSMGAIARLSNLPTSSLYWHFDSKQHLLATVAAEGASRWLDLIPDWKDLDGSFEGKLDRMLDIIARELKRRPELLRLQLTLYMDRARIGRRAAETIRQVRCAAVNKFKPAIESLVVALGGEPSESINDELGNFALSFTNGCFVDHQIDPVAINLGHRFKRQLHIALVALAKEIVERRSEHPGTKGMKREGPQVVAKPTKR